jgi:hypothetical protein
LVFCLSAEEAAHSFLLCSHERANDLELPSQHSLGEIPFSILMKNKRVQRGDSALKEFWIEASLLHQGTLLW